MLKLCKKRRLELGHSIIQQQSPFCHDPSETGSFPSTRNNYVLLFCPQTSWNQTPVNKCTEDKFWCKRLLLLCGWAVPVLNCHGKSLNVHMMRLNVLGRALQRSVLQVLFLFQFQQAGPPAQLSGWRMNNLLLKYFGLQIKSEVWLSISGWLLDAGELKGDNQREKKESHVFCSETKTEKKENS